MKTRSEIFQYITRLMADMFEVDATDMTEASRLYEDLDIDSIDAVDLIVELKKFTGKKISPENFKSVRTLGDVVTAVENLLAND